MQAANVIRTLPLTVSKWTQVITVVLGIKVTPI